MNRFDKREDQVVGGVRLPLFAVTACTALQNAASIAGLILIPGTARGKQG